MKKTHFDLLEGEKIIKDEIAMNSKFSLFFIFNHLYLTNQRIILTKSTKSWAKWFFGPIYYNYLIRKNEKYRKKNLLINLKFEEIDYFKQGKYGLNKNILEIHSKSGETHKIILTSKYLEWKTLLETFTLKELPKETVSGI